MNYSAPEYFCSSCGTGLAEEDLESGAAVRRLDEVYCRKWFRLF